ncbi:MAG TPA: hypothetical protein VF170_01750 [Planctomycetaceae bacterium]
MTRGHLFVTCLLLCAGFAHADEPPRPEWVYLDNGEVRIGVKTTSGGAIAYFSPSGSEKNLLNHFDHGRLVQQSYYGAPDGTTWAGKPWRWNPVQGGDYKGGPAKLLEIESGDTSLSTRSVARHWSGCVDLPEVTFEQRITLDGGVAHVRFRMTYAGDMKHPPAHQEIPAVFVEPEYDTLVLYDGDRPWTGGPLSRSKPGWPNESRRMTERWAAYVNADGFGVGAYVPIAEELTCYRYAAGQPSDRGACSYFAPLTTFAVTPGLTFEYDLYLTCGTAEEIREAFRRVRDAREEQEPRNTRNRR